MTRITRSSGWNARAGNATRVWPVCARIHCYRIFTSDPRWDAFLRKMGLADDQLK